MQTPPDDEKDLLDATVQIFFDQQLQTGPQSHPCDRMIIRNKQSGQEDDLVIFAEGNRRRVNRVSRDRTFLGSEPSSRYVARFRQNAEPITPDDQHRFLEIYDLFPDRMFKA